jgi:hypothetical protein
MEGGRSAPKALENPNMSIPSEIQRPTFKNS